MNGLDIMEAKVQHFKSQKINSASITVSDNGQSLIARHPYYNSFIKLPYFHLLTVGEKSEVKRIFDEADFGFFAERVQYHYDNDRHPENGYSYVIDNLRYILALPNSDSKVPMIKFLMIASLGKMKFLSKRNIDLFFVERHSIMDQMIEDRLLTLSVHPVANKRTLEDIFILLKRVKKDSKFLYSDKAEALSYLRMTLARWVANENMTLHEVIMMQEVFGVELPAINNDSANSMLNGSIQLFIKSFLNSITDYYDNSFDVLKFLFDKKSSDGIIDATARDVVAYSTFFNWKPPFFDEFASRTVCSLSNFKKTFVNAQLDDERFSGFLVSSVVPKFPSLRLVSGKSVSTHNYYFLFCLLKGDEDKTLELINFLESNNINILIFSQKERYDFLSMIKEYAECDYTMPLSLLFNMYGFDLV